MRTNIVIDEKLMKKASKVLGTKSKRETVEAALRRAINLSEQAKIKKLFGKVKWEGNLDELRSARW
ncbi:MAG: type II toxin-antitoxin system VapB family antitoxin [Bacteroidetes bacterium]|nr:type II toxin-antitoxin system VapB family antitoxin [Bacteroidota bacterium]